MTIKRLIIGPPGTGKSTRAKKYVEDLLEKGNARPDEICLVSFTNAAAQTLRGRGVPVPRQNIGTLHSFAFRAGKWNKEQVAESKIDSWNESNGSNLWLGSGQKKASPEYDMPGDGVESEFEGDELLNKLNVFRARMVSKTAWPLPVQAFSNKWEKWKEENNLIDFTDMIELALLDVECMPGEPRIIIADECLPYKTPVLLSDGTSKTIGDIVEGNLPVSVLSYDTHTGEQRTCKVTKWSKTLNQKPLVKITAQLHGRIDKHKVSNFVVCTTDHKIWADNQWIEAGKLKPGMVAQIETSAQKSQVYKISGKGKKSLSTRLTDHNPGQYLPDKPNHILEKNRGGNGRGLTIPQQVLLEALGDGWQAEYPVRTGKKRNSGFPSSYKLDIANLELKIGVEVDGHSHNNSERKAQDIKKDTLLKSLGWQVLRFKNVEAVQNASEIAAQILQSIDCPVPATIISVEPTTINDYYVYDIGVEDCHNFYANGILVHNCQDFTPLELALLRKWALKAEIINYLADPDQLIYNFKGAEPSFFLDMKNFDMVQTLEQSYRVPRAVHRVALSWIDRAVGRNKVVYHPTDKEGSVAKLTGVNFKEPQSLIKRVEKVLGESEQDVMIMASCTYMLDDTVKALREAGIPFHNPNRTSQGKWNPLGGGGVTAAQRLLAFLRPSNVWGEESRFYTAQDLQAWVEPLQAKGCLKHGAKTEIERLEPGQDLQVLDLMNWFENTALDRVMELDTVWYQKNLLPARARLQSYQYPFQVMKMRGAEELLKPKRVKIGTIHSFKGDEAEVVFMFPDLSSKGMTEWETGGVVRDRIYRQAYVGITRASDKLFMMEAESPLAIRI